MQTLFAVGFVLLFNVDDVLVVYGADIDDGKADPRNIVEHTSTDEALRTSPVDFFRSWSNLELLGKKVLNFVYERGNFNKEETVGTTEFGLFTQKRSNDKTRVKKDYSETWSEMSVAEDGFELPSCCVSIVQTNLSVCSGDLISDDVVLTTADCVTHLISGMYRVLKPEELEIHISSTFSITGGQVDRPRNVRVHPAFLQNKQGFNGRDVSTIILSKTVKLGGNIKVAHVHDALSESDIAAMAGNVCQLVSWKRRPGTLDRFEIVHSNVTIVHWQHCVLIDKRRVDPATQVCGLVNTNDTCEDTIGGTMFCDGKILGLRSRGQKCSRGYPIVFTRVDNLREFLFSAARSIYKASGGNRLLFLIFALKLL